MTLLLSLKKMTDRKVKVREIAAEKDVFQMDAAFAHTGAKTTTNR